MIDIKELAKYIKENRDMTNGAGTVEIKAGALATAILDKTAEVIEHLLDKMTPEERRDITLKYCSSCGVKDIECQCWNDA